MKKRIVKSRRARKSRVGTTQRKILLLLFTGVALGLSGSPRQYFKILKAFRADWKNIGNGFSRSVSTLHGSGFIKYKRNEHGNVEVHLTSKGYKEAQKHALENLSVPKQQKWDRKWRIVAFDIPSRKNAARDILRHHLKNLGFIELQQSIFIHPFPSREIIQEIVDFYQISKHVIYMEIAYIDGYEKLRKSFLL